jgi:MinD-like ATPase involved in chromosome partitioning or flagellar assembly
MADPISSPGTIITFYSYKGGTGRSMALANVACLAGRSLAAEHQKVLMIDWDLEAPGLHRYFPESESSENADRPGLIDYFTRLTELLNDQTYSRLSGPEGWRVLQTLLPLDEYMVPVVADGVDFVKAGRFVPEYTHLISTFQWAEFYRRYRRVYRAFREYLTARYKLCFIDSRTGLSDVSGVCTMLMPEKLVTVFTPNRQSLEGVLEIAAKAIEYRRNSDDPRPLSVFPLPSRIVTEEHKLLQGATDRYRTQFEECLRVSYELEECNLGAYFEEVAIPHKGFYGFHEMVAVRDDPSASDALSINRAYERFFERLVMLDCAWEPMPSGVKPEVPPEPKASVRPPTRALLKDMGFECDVFISYAHIDDLSMADTDKGFVARLQEDLSVRLTQFVGRPVRIWRDSKLGGNDLFSEQSGAALEKAAILLTVVSPQYVKSEWCRRELATFVKVAESQGGVSVGERSRVLWVAKTPLPRESLPEILRGQLGYEFYRVADSGRPREFFLDADPGARSAYLARVDDIAYDISSLLNSMRGAPGTQPEAGSVVYLAESTSDVSERRDQLRRELTDRGYHILPDKPLPWSSEELISFVRHSLDKAQLSIHLIGSKSGFIPEGETRSIVNLQYDLALEAGLDRIVWASPALELTDEALARVLAGEGADTDIFRTNFQEMVSIVLDRLAGRSRKQVAGGVPQIYVLCEASDLPAAKQVRNYLSAKGCEATLPLFQDDPAVLRRDRQEMLQACDGAVVFWGSGSEAWLRMALRDLLKVRGRGRSKRLPFVIYIAEPTNAAKEDFDTQIGSVIRGGSPSAIDPLLEEIRSPAHED